MLYFITGGEGNGQEEYAREHFPEMTVFGNYLKTVEDELHKGEDPLLKAEELLRSFADSDLVIWTCETGCGIVPADAAARRLREASGRVNCYFAKRAAIVIRMVCGIGTVIKDTRSGQTAFPHTGKKARQARSIMVLGTMSGAGKSLIAAGLCRIFADDGYSVAPFKAQNMALNSFVTENGEEMGRAQAVQAEACRRKPDVRMNPILLKPTTDKGSQIIVMGHPVADMGAAEYYRRKQEYLPYVEEAFESLASENDILVLEGAGSPAEINLKEHDIVNMKMASFADAPVILVGNIDPGGVFAQLYGTVMLLDENERDRIRGLIINKFRGDLSILEPGIGMLEEKTGKKVLGVVPYADLNLEPEDSLDMEERLLRKGTSGTDPKQSSHDFLDIAVIRLPKISNFTDFEALHMEPDVRIRYISDPSELKEPDLIILPGTKSTIADLTWLRQTGLEKAIREAHAGGSFLMGICGGYQMLGRTISDPEGMENRNEMEGMGFLGMDTIFFGEKVLKQTETLSDFGIPEIDGKRIRGYEVHMGKDGSGMRESRGNGSVIGTYIHGVFDEEEFRSAFLEYLISRKGGKRDLAGTRGKTYREFKEEQYVKLAQLLREHLDIPELYRMMGLLPHNYLKPAEIEKRSFEILTGELKEQGIVLKGDTAPVIQRCIHTTADFDYAKTLCFSPGAVSKLEELIRSGATFVTDTNMALSGINTRELRRYGAEACCFMADEEVAREAAERGITRASVSMEKAMRLPGPVVFVSGNAPTALMTLWEHYTNGDYNPAFIIGVPVGFVNVEAAKELIMGTEIPHIVNRGRKGGSNVAAAIVNAVLYGMRDRTQ